MNFFQTIIQVIQGIMKGLASVKQFFTLAPRVLTPMAFAADFPLVGIPLFISCTVILAFIVVDFVRDLL